MESQWLKKAFAFWPSTLLFLAGMAAGTLLTLSFVYRNSPPPPLLLPDLLGEAHRLLEKGLFAEAEKEYLAILGRDPGNAEALTHLGNIAFQRGDVKRALAYYEEALRRDPLYAHALWDQGIALRAKGDDAGAVKAWEAFAQLFPPDSPDVVTVKGWIAEAQKQRGSSKPVYLVPAEALKELSRR